MYVAQNLSFIDLSISKGIDHKEASRERSRSPAGLF